MAEEVHHIHHTDADATDSSVAMLVFTLIVILAVAAFAFFAFNGTLFNNRAAAPADTNIDVTIPDVTPSTNQGTTTNQ